MDLRLFNVNVLVRKKESKINISVMKEKKKKTELPMGCTRMMCGKYRTRNVNRYEQRTM